VNPRSRPEHVDALVELVRNTGASLR
jgi:hypothetical protein